MDILKYLKESPSSLIAEDLDVFITELETGDYTAAYIAECKKYILALQKKPAKTSPTIPDFQRKVPKGIKLPPSVLTPQKDSDTPPAAPTPLETFQQKLAELHELDDYKTGFKSYIKECDFVDTAFLDAHFNLFDEWEINTILMIKQVDESFLEKYFCSLDPKKISRYQKFSESFFMHHFNQLDADLILKRGLNEWCAKENRSKQLDVFLRLKGVKL